MAEMFAREGPPEELEIYRQNPKRAQIVALKLARQWEDEPTRMGFLAHLAKINRTSSQIVERLITWGQEMIRAKPELASPFSQRASDDEKLCRRLIREMREAGIQGLPKAADLVGQGVPFTRELLEKGLQALPDALENPDEKKYRPWMKLRMVMEAWQASGWKVSFHDEETVEVDSGEVPF